MNTLFASNYEEGKSLCTLSTIADLTTVDGYGYNVSYQVRYIII